MKNLLLTMVLTAAIGIVCAQQNSNPYQQQNNGVPPQQQQQQQRSSYGSGFTRYARINLYGAYVFDDDFESYYSDYDYYYGTLEGGFFGGGGLEYVISPRSSIELQYLVQNTNAPTYYRRDVGLQTVYDNFVVGLDYIFLGFNKMVTNAKGNIEGYGGLQVGMAIVSIDSPSRGASGSIDKFAWGLRLGCNIWVTPRIAIKLQPQLISIVDGAGGGLYFGTGGAGVGVSTYSTFYQFGLGGGLAFRLGNM